MLRLIVVSPKVSIVMSVYNSENHLSEAIDSILNQTLSDFEFIIVNDGSKDTSLDILKYYAELDDRLIIISRENKGLAYSLNEAINLSKGEYLARMDSDDICFPERLEEQVSYMEKYNIDICGSWVERFGSNIKTSTVKITDDLLDLQSQLLFTVCFFHPTLIAKRVVWSEFNLSYPVDFKFGEDYALWVKLIDLPIKISNIQKVLLRYRVENNSMTSNASDNDELSFKYISKSFKEVLTKFNRPFTDEEYKMHFYLSYNTSGSLESRREVEALHKYLMSLVRTNEFFNRKSLFKIISDRFIALSLKALKKDYRVLFTLMLSPFFWKGILNFIIKRV